MLLSFCLQHKTTLVTWYHHEPQRIELPWRPAVFCDGQLQIFLSCKTLEVTLLYTGDFGMEFFFVYTVAVFFFCWNYIQSVIKARIMFNSFSSSVIRSLIFCKFICSLSVLWYLILFLLIVIFSSSWFFVKYQSILCTIFV